MTDIGAWLEELGLVEYAETFGENKLDFDVLPSLTGDDLKDLGIPLGDRKRLLSAIADLSPIPVGAERHVAPDIEERSIATSDAERRHLTVMFCDLVDSTALSTRIDPEDLREVILSFQECCEKQIERFGGYVARYMGDGLLAYFGYPQAHEDDAERAVRAGLDVTRAVRTLTIREGLTLSVRVGIATGNVIAGDVIGEGSSEEAAALGETPNLAARLQSLAKPDTVMISVHTRRLTGELFTYQDAGNHSLKGFPGMMQVWQVVSEAASESRFAATRSLESTPLVGRETEVSLLLDRWERAKDAEGQVVLLSGEPGIGKSRLSYTLLDRLGSEPHAVLQFQCSPHYTNTAFYPFIEHIQRACKFTLNETPESKLDKLEKWAEAAYEPATDVLPLLASLLAVSTDDRYPVLDVNPQRLKEMTIEAVRSLVVSAAKRAPLLLMFEDVHWADPTTLDVLGVVIDAATSEKILLVITHRPEFVPPWQGRGHVTAHSLARLGKRQMTGIVDGITNGRPLPAVVLREITARTDGVPLFVEEFTKAVLESGYLTDTGTSYVLDGPLPPLSVPSTLQDSLVARLDRLGSVKHIAQVAAAIGREFSYAVLAAISPLDDAELQDALIQLEAAELIFCRGIPPEATYTFKHALVQDAAYDSLLKRRRERLHAELAAVLETRFPSIVSQEPELLAIHHSAAGSADKAIAYWQEAARNSLNRSAYPEELAHLDSALHLLKTLAERHERYVKELQLQIARGGALMAIRGYLAPETMEAFVRAHVLSKQVGDERQSFTVLRALHGVHFTRAEHDKAFDVGTECLRMAENNDDRQPRSLAHRLVGQSLYMKGALQQAHEHLEQSLRLDKDARAEDVAALVHGGGHRLMTPAFLAQVLWLKGFPDRALALARDGLREAEQYGAFGISASMFFLCRIHGWRREYQRLTELAQQLSRLANEHGISAWVSDTDLIPDWPRLAQGDPDARASLARERIETVRRSPGQMTPFNLGLLADAIASTDLHEAANVVDEALALTAATGERWSEAELLRIKAELELQKRNGRSAAEELYRQSLQVAREQGAASWELRTAISLARLLRHKRSSPDAARVLAPVYESFVEGFETEDLREARKLLDELAS